MVKTRFAPSPTGFMHFGNLRTAIFNYLLARKLNGKFLLRVEDTDPLRSKKEFTDSIIEDLNWLNLDWDEQQAQSARNAVYDKYYKILIEQGLAYPCFCSEEQLQLTRKLQLKAGQPPRYPGTCRHLSAVAIKEKLAANEAPALRFMTPDNITIDFVDLVKGPQKFFSNDIGDFIIKRANNAPSFMFCNAIDDAEMQVTHALRGDDHLTNTPRQIMLLQALNLPQPQYGHFAMILGLDGSPLSKRNGSAAVKDLRAQGVLPLALINYLSRLGHSYQNNNLLTLEQLSDEFSLEHINKAASKHDAAHIKHWQKTTINNLSNTELLTWLHEYKLPQDSAEQFINAVKDNIIYPKDVDYWFALIYSDKLLLLESAELEILKQAGKDYLATLLQAIESEKISYQSLIDYLKNELNIKGKALFMPLRVALTGKTSGPELTKIWDLMDLSKLRKLIANCITLIS